MSTAILHELDLTPPADRLQRILDAPEDQWFDRKSARAAPKDLARPLIAFANAEGGTLAIGLRDGSYDGELLTPEKENAIRQASIDFTVPPVRNTVSRLELEDRRSLLLIEVPPSEHVHESAGGDVYLRVGDESKRLSYGQRRELEYDRGSAQFEYEPAIEATPDDLDAEEVARYREAIGAGGEMTPPRSGREAFCDETTPSPRPRSSCSANALRTGCRKRSYASCASALTHPAPAADCRSSRGRMCVSRDRSPASSTKPPRASSPGSLGAELSAQVGASPTTRSFRPMRGWRDWSMQWFTEATRWRVITSE